MYEAVVVQKVQVTYEHIHAHTCTYTHTCNKKTKEKYAM